MISEKIFLIRHGETEWSLSGQHTGKTDIPLTENGKEQSIKLGKSLQKCSFFKAFVSPLLRARTTFELMKLDVPSVLDEDLYEWDYGDYEGLTTAEIQKDRPGWSIFKDGAPGGESLEAVRARAEKMITKIKDTEGVVVVFSSGHFSRVLASAWLGHPTGFGSQMTLSACSLSVLGYEHGDPAILAWNATKELLS
jgi:broad specificity phosphatase PhoE